MDVVAPFKSVRIFVAVVFTKPLVRVNNVFTLAGEFNVTPVVLEFDIVKLLKVVVLLPEMDCADVPAKTAVPLLCVKVPLFVKPPDKLKLPDVDLKVPALIVSSFKVTACAANDN
jgi:hypothetical protein